MAKRLIVTLHLPLEMGAVNRILKAVARDFPDAVIAEPAGDRMSIHADPDVTLTERRRIVKERARGR